MGPYGISSSAISAALRTAEAIRLANDQEILSYCIVLNTIPTEKQASSQEFILELAFPHTSEWANSTMTPRNLITDHSNLLLFSQTMPQPISV